MNPHELDHNIITHINQKAKELEDVLKTDVVCYIGQIDPRVFRAFRNFIEEVKEKSDRTENAITVILRTPGGSVETTERFVNVLRKHYDTVDFIVPDMAMSAGTIFCMSGDRIRLDYSSSLGPIDPQVMAPDGSGYVAALGYLDQVAKITKKKDLTPADVIFLKTQDLGRLALFEQARDLSVDLLKKWLVEFKFKDWTVHRTNNPGTKVTVAEKKKRAEEIARELANHKKWFSHGRSLDIEKLKELRIDIDDYSDDPKLSEAIRGYNDPLTAFVDRMGVNFHLHSHLTETL